MSVDIDAVGAPGTVRRHDRRLVILMVSLVLLHLLLLVYDSSHPGAFLRGDRSASRIASVTGFAHVVHAREPLAPFLATHGVVGDYLLQALLYLAGGAIGVIIAQVLLHLASVVALYRLTVLVGGTGLAPLLAALSYALLPNSLACPHQLVSEAPSVPLVVISFYFLARYVRGRGATRTLLGSGLLIGTAAIVRPVLALWPFVAVCFLLPSHRSWRQLKRALAFLAVSCAFPLAWLFFMFHMTGAVSEGASHYDLRHNLYDGVRFMSVHVPPERQADIQARFLNRPGGRPGTLSPGEYARFVMDYPGVYVRYRLYDTGVFLAKSESARLFVDYMPQLLRTSRLDADGWKPLWEREGLLAMLRELIRRNPGLLISSVLGSLLFVLFMGIAGLGIWHGPWRRDAGHAQGAVVVRGMMVALIFYVAFASQVAAYAPSRHRGPAEFALATFFGMEAARRLGSARRGRGTVEADPTPGNRVR